MIVFYPPLYYYYTLQTGINYCKMLRRSFVTLVEITGWMEKISGNKNGKGLRQATKDKYLRISPGAARSMESFNKARKDSKLTRTNDYWDVVPSEFRSETAFYQAKGAGFNGMFEDRNPRSVAISNEIDGSRHQPALDVMSKPGSRPNSQKTTQEAYSNIPELKMLGDFNIKRPKSKEFPYYDSMYVV